MSFVSISEAIRLSGVSRATFYNKYLKQGKVTVSRDSKDKKCIDTSEILRVFGKLAGDEQPIQVDSTKEDQENTIGHDYTALRQQIEHLEQQLKQEISRGDELKRDKELLREDNNWYQQNINTLTDTIKLLEDKREDKNISSRWWSWWR